jgi:hypothetical protein
MAVVLKQYKLHNTKPCHRMFLLVPVNKYILQNLHISINIIWSEVKLNYLQVQIL